MFKAVMACFKDLSQSLSVYSDDESASNSNNLQTVFKEEGITRIIMKTHANPAERMIPTIQKKMVDKLRQYKTNTWVEALKLKTFIGQYGWIRVLRSCMPRLGETRVVQP